MEQIKEISLDEWLHESPFNPRLNFDESKLEELAQTMRAPHGRVQQPIVVRAASEHTAFKDADAQQWEIVFGHRRARAARLAGLASVPAIVREMTDEEVQQAQIVENLQREGVNPIEEADAMARLKNDHGATIESLMQQAGKSRSYVYNRLRLATAHGDVRLAVQLGELDAEIAQEVARRPLGLQVKAMRAVNWMSVRNAKAELQRSFQFDLDRAPFDQLSIKLLPEAGACDACTKRSDAEPVLLDEYGENVCMDGECFGKKSTIAREIAEKAAAKERAKAAASSPQQLTPAAAWPFPQRSQGLPGIEPAPEDDDHDQDDVQVDDDYSAEDRAVLDHWHEIMLAMMRTTLTQPRTTDDLRFLLERELDLGGSDFGKAEEVLGWDLPGGAKARKEKLVELSADQLAALMMMVGIETATLGYGRSSCAIRIALAQRFGVNVLDHVPVQTPADDAPTPPLAAQAGKKAKAAPAGAKGKAKTKGKAKEQKDDAGVAGGGDGQVDAFAEAE